MQQINRFLNQVKLPKSDSHKGQNGKLLIIGGSELFHAASKWSLDVASKFVDMVFYSSVPENNELIQQAKGEFWNGIVVPRGEVESYLEEADCVLIGPGMDRSDETENLVNGLLKKYGDKKWVVDAGALQMVDVDLLNENCVITPHKQEVERFELKGFSGVAVVKGEIDVIYENGEKVKEIAGGNAGMTKGGTGDVLAGLVAALYCQHDAMTAVVVGSYVNKKAGDNLWEKVGPYFNASDLVDEVPKVMWNLVKSLDN
jgi:hydroxyethylthiazole kinase-like uncharacterized protein yjeF